MLRNGSVSEVTVVCVCVRIDEPESDSSHIVEREKDGGRNSGRSIVAPSSSQVNIDTAWADTAPEALINHFQWSDTNTHTRVHRLK